MEGTSALPKTFEAHILRNVDYVSLEKTRIWCNIAILVSEPEEEKKNGHDRVFQGYDLPNIVTFTRPIFPHEKSKIIVPAATDPEHGSVIIGSDIYTIQSNILSKSSRSLIYEVKKFDDHDQIREYLSEELRRLSRTDGRLRKHLSQL